jgi:predicted nucleotidyltransferase
MPNTNASFSPRMRSDELKEQIGKLERLEHRAPVLPTLDNFDEETEALLGRLYGDSHKYLEAYKYATVAESEALVNLPESAQEPMAKTAVQQRRQVLLGILSEMQDMEAKEVAMLTGEDREDPPSI